MLFSSYEFLFGFFPVVIIVYYLLLKLENKIVSRIWLITASLFFYGWFNAFYLPIIICTIIVNFTIGKALALPDKKPVCRKLLLAAGGLFNLGLLAYYKYYDFFALNINAIFQTDIVLKHLLLPLGISFIAFVQFSYLLDAYKGNPGDYNIIDFSLFVTFFPHLIAGPIILHHELMPQFKDREKQKLIWENIAAGLFVFSIGFFQKLFLADTFAAWATKGFDTLANLTFAQSWVASLSYTLQIFLDFSGYSTMAIGLALMFNIKFPNNFNLPYLSQNIPEFWRRWHITLGRALSTYIYIPLGGNRKGEARTYINLMATFLVSGLWHGAAWNFVVWGGLHGAACVIQRIWQKAGRKIPVYLAVPLTLLFVNFTWVLFRAETWKKAISIIKAMLIPKGFGISSIGAIVDTRSIAAVVIAVVAIIVGIYMAFKMPDAISLADKFKPTLVYRTATVVLLLLGILCLTRVSPFIYYNF